MNLIGWDIIKRMGRYESPQSRPLSPLGIHAAANPPPKLNLTVIDEVWSNKRFSASHIGPAHWHEITKLRELEPIK